ncbi:InlB B-repeat-containing protein [Bifidobacterium sp. ESL0745]|uniref:InlB B-repeat-containing protein n=1 Tax=Bifidobacterium sp. ESL0745 TaxID=2983226 RepID=UPI0023F96071|nr:InlB B-repeat-containing protein [Bifidobacterium sp. ESL0745]MDF7665484.1 InlB B-repeat-containing protein [Bifidobacterium sp. ESL0745]
MKNSYLHGDDQTWNNQQWISQDGLWKGQPFSDGIHPNAGSPKQWYGLVSSPSVSFDVNGGSTIDVPTRLQINWPDQVDSSVTLPAASVMSRSGYRFSGWSKTSTPSSADYMAGQVVDLPLGGVADRILYAVWMPTPTVSNDLVFPWMNGGVADKVKVLGTVPQGANIYALQASDKIEVSLMPKDSPSSTTPSVGTAAAANDVTLNTTLCTSTACNWSATFPMSALSDADHVGQGMSYVFRALLVTGSAGNSDYAFSAGKQADVVAPVIADTTFNKNARTVSGVVWSGDAIKQTSRVKETKFTVTVTWPTGSSTSSTTLTCTDGTASVSGATCPTSGSGEGTFMLPVPSDGVVLNGNSQMQAKDAPAAAEPTLVGTGEPNVSAAVTFDTTLPVVSSLPMTGGDAPTAWWHHILLPAIFAGMLAMVVGARRRRLAMKR